jgi:two-component system sensor histidine kinase UhpB
LKQIDEKWFGRTINRFGRYLTYAGYAAAVAILLIAGLVGWNRTLRKRILQRTAALGESEQRFRQIAENIHEIFWLIDMVKQTMLYVSPAYEAVWGRSRESLYREPRSFINAIHPEDRARVVDIIGRDREQDIEVEYRVVRPDGSIRWIRDRGFPIKDESGHFYRVAGIAEDITERKRAEEKLRTSSKQLRALTAKLRSAREEESIRIAREIHDELGAMLTSLRWDLEEIQRTLSMPLDQSQLTAVGEKLSALMKLDDRAINALRRIASELRPSILDDLGLVAAIEWQSQQFQKRTGIVCVCDCFLKEDELTAEQSTAVFRILQEALTNVLRHAQATRVDIKLDEENNYFSLSISDNGKGITECEKSEQLSLGILGMRERAHLIGAEIDIKGVAGKGTVVTVRVPIDQDRF